MNGYGTIRWHFEAMMSSKLEKTFQALNIFNKDEKFSLLVIQSWMMIQDIEIKLKIKPGKGHRKCSWRSLGNELVQMSTITNILLWNVFCWIRSLDNFRVTWCFWNVFSTVQIFFNHSPTLSSLSLSNRVSPNLYPSGDPTWGEFAWDINKVSRQSREFTLVRVSTYELLYDIKICELP